MDNNIILSFTKAEVDLILSGLYCLDDDIPLTKEGKKQRDELYNKIKGIRSENDSLD